MFNLFSKGRIPKRWHADSLRAVLETTARRDVIEEVAGDRRVHVRAPEDAEWTPRHHRFSGNVLVVADIQFAGSDPNTASVYKDYVDCLETIADWRLPVSQFAFVLGTELTAEAVFDAVLAAIGVRHHSISVVDLLDGSAVAWDAVDGRTSEVEPMAPDGADDDG